MNPENQLSVFAGCPHRLGQLPDGACLVLDAEEEVLEEFKHHYSHECQQQSIKFRQVVLSSRESDHGQWFCFNDARFNGFWPLQNWIDRAPNLKQNDCHTVKTETLFGLLDQAIDFDPTSRIHLYLRQGDPVEILNGLGQKLANCDRILFRYPWLPKSIQSQVEAILLRNGFVQSKNDDYAWVRYQYDFKQSMPDQRLLGPLLSLFDSSLYRQIYPNLHHFSDQELLEHWLNQPNRLQLAFRMRELLKTAPRAFEELQSGDPIRTALFQIFPFNLYRHIRPDLAGFDDEQLVRHFCLTGLGEGSDLSESVAIESAQSSSSEYIASLEGRIAELELLLKSLYHQDDKLQSFLNKNMAEKFVSQ